jgi:hypothetical protein
MNKNRIYVLDGEQWGGISDRYIAVPSKYINTYLEIVDPIIKDPVNLTARLQAEMEMQSPGENYLNPEKFLAFRMRKLRIWKKLSWLPYIPFAVRLPGGHTRWSEGEYNYDLGYFVKYAGELQRSNVVQRHINSQSDWVKYFRKYKGFQLRHRISQENDKIMSGR